MTTGVSLESWAGVQCGEGDFIYPLRWWGTVPSPTVTQHHHQPKTLQTSAIVQRSPLVPSPPMKSTTSLLDRSSPIAPERSMIANEADEDREEWLKRAGRCLHRAWALWSRARTMHCKEQHRHALRVYSSIMRWIEAIGSWMVHCLILLFRRHEVAV